MAFKGGLGVRQAKADRYRADILPTIEEKRLAEIRRAAFPLQEAALLTVASIGMSADRLLYLGMKHIYLRNR